MAKKKKKVSFTKFIKIFDKKHKQAYKMALLLEAAKYKPSSVYGGKTRKELTFDEVIAKIKKLGVPEDEINKLSVDSALDQLIKTSALLKVALDFAREKNYDIGNIRGKTPDEILSLVDETHRLINKDKLDEYEVKESELKTEANEKLSAETDEAKNDELKHQYSNKMLKLMADYEDPEFIKNVKSNKLAKDLQSNVKKFVTLNESDVKTITAEKGPRLTDNPIFGEKYAIINEAEQTAIIPDSVEILADEMINKVAILEEEKKDGSI